ncbi:mitochondrial protein translocase, MPT family isoform 1 [Galdieria sulphuraria]|uniref:Mitochondrial protein translocase, MPT family isoform 1 n=1 Tax=Galdieria sulphuraria TaxID=130081 RepID=M2XP20_GALSU|nr:mitochondrial protein translocase, MPT family isoform 1 [Galdieria sulphuraria]EME31912.1 mitochondrial protein translocase, MPT family isoform 1 [Galdieria sulphuraria]|eukprot:XP_005708432.1 mitochondrial protein translocase, MPT family isoform 1 [Galdieria sulphuraria]
MLCSVSRTGFLFSSPYRSSTNISERLKHKACFTKHVSWSRPWICRRCEVFCNKSTNGSRTSTDFADITEQNRKKVLNLYEMYGLQSAAAYSLSLDKSHIASAVLLNLLVQLCCREGDVVFALKVAEELTKRGQATSFTFREIVRFFIRQRNLAGVQYIWKYCSQTGIEKDFVMYSCYVYCLVGANLVEEAVATVYDFLAKSSLSNQFIPFQSSFDWLIRKLVRERSDIRGWTLFKELHSKGFRVPVITFNIFLDFFGRRRSRREVEEILYLMESDGIEPDRVTYNTLIKAYGYMRRHDLAEAAFKQQTSKFGPQLVGFNTLMNGYCEDKKFSRVLELFAQLKELGLKPDVKTYSTIIKGQIASGENPDTVMYWYGQMKDENITPDLKLAYSVLTFCTRKLCIEGVCLVLNDIRNIQNPLDAAIIQYFMDNLRNIPGSWEVRELLSRYPDLMDEKAQKQFEEWKG